LWLLDLDEEDNPVLREHKYLKFISKTLFDKCQEVKYKRGHNRYKITKQPFTFKGLIKCKCCHCSYSPYVKKGYTYIRPNNTKTKCRVCKNISEDLVLKDLEAEWKRIEIPKEILEKKREEIKKALESELKDKSTLELNLKSDLEKVKSQIRNWNLRCAEDLSITMKERQEFLEPLKIKETELELQIQHLNNGTYKFEVTLNSLLDLAACSYKLFKMFEN
jgi:site-specific DNA recombinase